MGRKDPFRNTYRYQKFRDSYKKRYPLCAECKRNGRIYPGDELDHIIPVSKGGAKYDEANVEHLCRECHQSKSISEKAGFGFCIHGKLRESDNCKPCQECIDSGDWYLPGMVRP